MSTLDPAAEPAPQKPAATTAVKAPVVAKVKASTVSAGTIAAVVLVALSQAQNDELFHGLPDWVTVLVGIAITVAGTFTAGYNAPYTRRPDVPLARR